MHNRDVIVAAMVAEAERKAALGISSPKPKRKRKVSRSPARTKRPRAARGAEARATTASRTVPSLTPPPSLRGSVAPSTSSEDTLDTAIMAVDAPMPRPSEDCTPSLPAETLKELLPIAPHPFHPPSGAPLPFPFDSRLPDAGVPPSLPSSREESPALPLISGGAGQMATPAAVTETMRHYLQLSASATSAALGEIPDAALRAQVQDALWKQQFAFRLVETLEADPALRAQALERWGREDSRPESTGAVVAKRD